MRTRRGWSAPRLVALTAYRPRESETRYRACASVFTRATTLPFREKTSWNPGSGFEQGLPTRQTGLDGLRTTEPLRTALPDVGPPAALPQAARRPSARTNGAARATPG